MQKSPLSPEQLAENLADIHPTYSRDEAVVAAGRCLFCYDAPCMRACPTHIDVPRFIRQILHDNVAGAAKTIAEENVFGGSCARACPTEVLCEGACVDHIRSGAPIDIGRLQQYATDTALARGWRFFEPGPATGKRVAVVGSGPAGLSCAHELRKLGHAVTVFEAKDVPGGLNTLGIAAYKVSREYSLREIEPILAMGMELKLNTPVDGPGLQKMLTDFDAVFLGVGLGATQQMGLPGENLPGVWEALQFIYQLHQLPPAQCHVGQRVVVIGCGNTAIDAATQALALGAEQVTITYRRSAAEKSAYNYEYELGQVDGVRFEWFASPLEFLEKDGQLCGVRFARTYLIGDGRTAELVNVIGADFTIPCDMAIKALGQTPVEILGSLPDLKLHRGALAVNPADHTTSIPGLFGGGDCTSRGKEIVNAVQDGKLAARSIDAYLAKKG